MGKYDLSVKVETPKVPDAPKTPDAPKWDEALPSKQDATPTGPAAKQNAGPSGDVPPLEVRAQSVAKLDSGLISGDITGLNIKAKGNLKFDLNMALTGKPNPSTREVTVAYRDLSLKMHPDKGGDPEAFKNLASARDLLKLEGPSGLKDAPSIPPAPPPKATYGAADGMPPPPPSYRDFMAKNGNAPPPPYRAAQGGTGGTAPMPGHIPTTRDLAFPTGAAPSSGKNFFQKYTPEMVQKNPEMFAAGAAALAGTAGVTGAVLAGTAGASGPSGSTGGVLAAVYAPEDNVNLGEYSGVLGYDVPYEPETPDTGLPVLGQVEYALGG